MNEISILCFEKYFKLYSKNIVVMILIDFVNKISLATTYK